MQKLLTIAIPTYNRGIQLKRTLNNFIQQITWNKLADLVEICVSDNASSDDTESIVLKLKSQYPAIISYYKNDKNVVWDNIKIVAQKATGEYIWFCGDDDEYFFDSVKNVINIIQNNCVDGIYVNQINPIGYTTKVENEGSYDLNSFFEIVKYDPEFISTVVIKKEMIAPKCHFNTWYHLDCLANLNNDSKIYICKNPNVLNCEPETNAWNKNYKNTLLYHIEQIELYQKSNMNSENIKNLTNIYIEFVKNNIIDVQLHDNFTQQEIKELSNRILKFPLDKKNHKLLLKLLRNKLYSIFYTTEYKTTQTKNNFFVRCKRVLKIYRKLKRLNK